LTDMGCALGFFLLVINCANIWSDKPFTTTRRLRIKRQVLINNVENGVFHGETKFIDTDPGVEVTYNFADDDPGDEIDDLEAEIAKKLGLSDTLETSQRRRLLSSLYGQSNDEEVRKLLGSIKTEESEKEQQDLLNKIKAENQLLTLIKAQREQAEKKKLLDLINDDLLTEQKIELIKQLSKSSSGNKETVLKELYNDVLKTERRKLLNNLYYGDIKGNEEAKRLLENIKAEKALQERRKLLNNAYIGKRPLMTDLRDNPYLGNKGSLLTELRSSVTLNSVVRQLEDLVLNLIRFGDLLSPSERMMILQTVYEKTQILQKRKWC